MALEIHIKVIPHERQRYETCGDYWYDTEGVLQVRVSDLGNEFYHKAIIIHELVEEAITKHKGISEKEIMDFDLYHNKRIEQGLIKPNLEAGFATNAPYRNEHCFATSVELGMCALAGVDFMEYDKAVNNL
jgi:hypothetical protein